MNECDTLIALAKTCQGVSDCDDSVNLARLVYHGSLIFVRLGSMNDMYERVDDDARVTRERRDRLRVEMSLGDLSTRIAADMPLRAGQTRTQMEAFIWEMQIAAEERRVAQAMAAQSRSA